MCPKIIQLQSIDKWDEGKGWGWRVRDRPPHRVNPISRFESSTSLHWRKPWFDQFWPHLLPPLPYIAGKIWISGSIWHRAIEIWSILQTIRIFMTHPDRFLNSSWYCVIFKFVSSVNIGIKCLNLVLSFGQKRLRGLQDYLFFWKNTSSMWESFGTCSGERSWKARWEGL